MKRNLSLVILMLMLLFISPCAFAQNEPDLTAAQNHRLQIEAKLGIKAHEEIYDVAAHYTGDYMMRQVPEDLDVLIS